MTDWKWFKAFVRRPGDQPLRIDTWSGGTTGYRYNQSWELLAANRHRVHTLCIRLRYDKKRLDNFFSQSAPRLEVLYLNRDGASGRYYHIQHPQPYIMPKLRELHIRLASTGDIGSLPPLIPTVTTITLSGCCHQMESEVLRRCPALRCLTIEDTQYSWIPLTGSAPLVLPELRTLQAHRAYLSTIISLPLLSLLQMEVSIVCPRDNLSQITQDFSTLLSACPNVQLEQRSFDLTYRYSSFTVTGQYTAGQGPISLGVVCPTLRDDDSLIIANSFVKLAQIVKAPICSIYVDDNGVIGGKLFYLFRDFADITMLRIDGQELFTLFLSLVDHSNAPCATEIAPLMSPSLARLSSVLITEFLEYAAGNLVEEGVANVGINDSAALFYCWYPVT
ncbi:hypothetical protein AX16_004652 [Volvariella volvacea WC 439]|nr:hypothetical protein AX16_004652 [Volvariella volvacea WC 439]